MIAGLRLWQNACDLLVIVDNLPGDTEGTSQTISVGKGKLWIPCHDIWSEKGRAIGSQSYSTEAGEGVLVDCYSIKEEATSHTLTQMIKKLTSVLHCMFVVKSCSICTQIRDNIDLIFNHNVLI